jgi:hypothetical protein
LITFHPDDWAPGQWSWLKSREPFSLFSGGFGSGKSTVGVAKILRLKCENGTVPGLVLAQSYGSLFNNIVEPFFSMCHRKLPDALHPKLKDWHGGKPHLLFPDGTVVHLRSAERPSAYDGLTVGWLYGDETRHWRHEAYQVAIARVRDKQAINSQKCFTSTPDVGWMSEEFNSGKINRELIIASTLENAHNLTPGYVEDLRRSYSPRLQKALIDGHFTLLEGAVYDCIPADMYSSQWCVDYKYTPADRVYLAVDPGARKSSWLFVAELRKHRWVVFDELQLDGVSDSEAVKRVNAKGYEIDFIWTDPAADATQSAYNLDTLAMLQGIKTRGREPIRHISGAFRSIAFGVDKLRTLLGDPDAGLDIRILFSRELERIESTQQRGIVRSLQGYRYPGEKWGQPVRSEPLKDGVTDHDCDALRYLAVGLWLSTGLRELDHKRLAEMAKGGSGYKIAA